MSPQGRTVSDELKFVLGEIDKLLHKYEASIVEAGRIKRNSTDPFSNPQTTMWRIIAAANFEPTDSQRASAASAMERASDRLKEADASWKKFDEIVAKLDGTVTRRVITFRARPIGG